VSFRITVSVLATATVSLAGAERAVSALVGTLSLATAELLSRLVELSAEPVSVDALGAYPRADAVSTDRFARGATGFRVRRAVDLGFCCGRLGCCSTCETGCSLREATSLVVLSDESGRATWSVRSGCSTTGTLRSRLSEQAETIAITAKPKVSRFIINPPEATGSLQ
jgi:hypothetical protein